MKTQQSNYLQQGGGGGVRKQMVGIVRKHMNFWELKGCAWQDQPASLQPDPDMHIYLFQYLPVTKNSIKLFVVAVNCP